MRFHRTARSAAPATCAPPGCCGAGPRKARAACLRGHSQLLEWRKQLSITAAKTQQMPEGAPAPLRSIAPSWSSCRRRMASSRRLPCRAGGSSCSAGRWLITCSTTSPSTETAKQQDEAQGPQAHPWLLHRKEVEFLAGFLPVATYPSVGTRCSSAMFSRPGTRRW